MTTNPSGDTTPVHRVWTEQRIRALGAITDLPTAAKILRLGRALAYELAKNNDFPVPVIRVGNRYRVPVAPLLATLHLPTVEDLTTSPPSSVDHHARIKSDDPPHTGAPTPNRGEP